VRPVEPEREERPVHQATIMNANVAADNLIPGPDAVRTASGAELAWVAWLYSADELSPAAVAAFETRLETDPQAGLALAEAVRLEEGFVVAATLESAPLALRESPSVPVRESGAARKARPVLWMLAGAALSLAAVAPFLSGWPTRPSEGKPVGSGEIDQLASVAQAWADRRAELADEEPALAALTPAEEPDLDDGELEPPAWMLLANPTIEE
jgi:hypothetical protein